MEFKQDEIKKDDFLDDAAEQMAEFLVMQIDEGNKGRRKVKKYKNEQKH